MRFYIFKVLALMIKMRQSISFYDFYLLSYKAFKKWLHFCGPPCIVTIYLYLFTKYIFQLWVIVDKYVCKYCNLWKLYAQKVIQSFRMMTIMDEKNRWWYLDDEKHKWWWRPPASKGTRAPLVRLAKQLLIPN